jgi:hypothetical protein
VKSTAAQITVTTFASEIHPEVTSEHLEDGELLAWADAHPTAWKIVTGHKSAPFGKKSCTYIGWAQGSDAPSAIIERLRTFRSEGRGREGSHPGSSIFEWRARYTMKHFEDKGFKGGHFRQWDGEYERHSLSLDYTPKTLDEVVDAFVKWCVNGPCRYEMREVRLDGKCVRRYDAQGQEVPA